MIRPMALSLALSLSLPALGQEVSALYQASYALEAEQDYEGALARMDALRKAGEDDYVVHLRRGWLLYLTARYADAVEAYRAAIQRDPDSVEAHTGLALPLMALRRWSEAEHACSAALRRAPGNYLAMTRRAYALYSAGRYDEAVSQYATLVAQYPSDVEMRAGLGWAQLKGGDTAAARASFDAVLRIAPSHVSAGQGRAAAR